MKKDKNYDDKSFKVEITDAKNNRLLFPYFDKVEIGENVSFEKFDKRYVFSKYYFGSARAIEFMTFVYDGKSPSSVKYFYINSEINLTKKLKEWTGKECETSSGTIPDVGEDTLLAASAGLCINPLRLKYTPNEYRGKDILFFISHVVNGSEKKQIPVIALDAKYSSSIDLDDIGCLNACAPDTGSVNYIGKINDKYRVSLQLNYRGNDVSGFYYYQKTRQKINIIGQKAGNRLVLKALVPEGTEKFEGVLDKGTFKGNWLNAGKNKEYPFSFYMAFLQ